MNPELNLCADTSAPMLPADSMPPTELHDASFKVIGRPVDNAQRRVVHGLDCQCNIDPDSSGHTVEEMKDQCTRLYIAEAKLEVLVFFFFCFFVFKRTLRTSMAIASTLGKGSSLPWQSRQAVKYRICSHLGSSKGSLSTQMTYVLLSLCAFFTAPC